MKKQMNKQIIIERPVMYKAEINIQGTTSLICNRRTEEKVEKKLKKRVYDDDKDFKSCLYPKVNGCYGFPSSAITKAVVSVAGTHAPGVFKTQARGSFYIPQDYLEIEGKPTLRSDVVLVKRNAIRRVRAEFKKWKIKIPIEGDENGVFSLEEIINLIAIAGEKCGIGDWRPEKNGIHGKFKILAKQAR